MLHCELLTEFHATRRHPILWRQKLHFSDDQIRWPGRPCSRVNADQHLGCRSYVNTAQTGADQTRPKASLSSKLSNHHFPSSRPQCLVSQGLCVCISATLFWAFMSHTISNPPLSLSRFLSLYLPLSLSLSFCTHQRDSNALCIMDGEKKTKKPNVSAFIWHMKSQDRND